MGQTVVISGAGIAGLVAAYWLAERGFSPVVIERAAALRATGHAVDLWGSAVEIVQRMGVLDQLEARATRNDRGTVVLGNGWKTSFQLDRISADIDPRHVEVMRSHLVEILAGAVRGRAEFVFGKTVARLEGQQGDLQVTLSGGRRIGAAAVLGADGVHSNIRGLGFRKEVVAERNLGAAIANWTAPNVLGLERRILRFVGSNRTLVIAPIPGTDRLAVVALFRRSIDLPREWRPLVRQRFASDRWPVDAVLSHIDDAEAYADTISTVTMPLWHDGGVALLGDAGFAPGAGVGGGTGLAVLSAYVLAEELQRHGIADGMSAYGRQMRPLVEASAAIGPNLLDVIIPRSGVAAAATVALTPVLASLPDWLRGRVPVLPRPAREGLRAIAGFPIR